MADVLCLDCARPVHDQAYVCADCAAPVERALRDLSALGGEASTTIARQARLGESGGPGDPLPFSWEAADAQWAVANTLTTWARHIAGERGRAIPARPGPAHGPLCRAALSCRHRSCTDIGLRTAVHPLTHLSTWLASPDQITWLRHRPEAVEALDELGNAARLATRTVDNPPDRWYAGPCGADPLDPLGEVDVDRPGACQAELYPVTGARTIRCPECGTQHDAGERKEWLLGLADDQLAHAAWLASVLTRLLDRTVTAAAIRGLAHRGRIVAHGTDVDGRPLYRLGDALAVVRDQDRTRERAIA
ncbi:MAG TPA: hypothetical protein VGM93_01340 [Acidimicrobiales bacterium]